MRTRASIGGHPVHAMLVPLPLGLFLAALVFDVLHAATGRPMWATVAFWDIAAGIAGALGAAVPGFVDYRTLRPPVRRIGTRHMILNLTVVGLFVLNLLTRTQAGRSVIGPGMGVPLTLTILAVGLLGVSGWLGAEMVYGHRVGVAERGDGGIRPAGRRAA
jgi:uncharacterized membrane protein